MKLSMPLNRTALNPFAHNCYEVEPRAGASPCPACHWVREQLAEKVVHSYSLKPDYARCELFQQGLEALGIRG